uniref:Uncharacterized protein n=1 Tax=Ciona savignyi TaxID=51511 RepID=H2Y713_CIOSA
MVDPDAPSRAEPKYREWYHWGVINVPDTNLNEGEVVATYIGAGPPQGTGLHRYVILIYEQNERIQFTEDHLGFSMKDRPSTKVQQTAKKHNLRLLAGACFQAEYDDYVPVLYSKFPDT